MHGTIDRLSRVFALLGGFVLTALIVLTGLSVLGRSINSMLHSDTMQSIAPDLAESLLATGVGPINGDFELIEAGMAFAVLAFLPLCQLNGAHASVDIFTARLPAGVQRFQMLVIDIVFAAVLAVIAWQLFEGMMSKLYSGQVTLLLQFPLWWAYTFSLIGAVISVIVSFYIAIQRVREALTGRPLLPAEQGAEH